MAAAILTGTSSERLELHEIQGLVARGYGRLHAACFLLLRFDDAARGRSWLLDLLPRITNAQRRPDDVATNVAFTFPGLLALGVDRDGIRGFPPAFVEGMVVPHRSRLLGDVGDSDPTTWAWGAPPQQLHAVLLLYATDDERLRQLRHAHERELVTRHVTLVAALATRLNRDRFGVKEHFGFRDGIGQPAIRGVHAQATADNLVAPGEFVLGYRNEYRQFPSTPVVRHDPTGALAPRDDGHTGFDLGRNGSYLVVRQLEQHVSRFWQTLRARTTSDEHMVWLASKMIGRWPSGASLAVSPERDVAGIETWDGFGYAGDPHGFACPLGAHARRANPRDMLPDARPGDASLAITKRHRLIRRGRAYGAPLDPDLDPVRMLHAADDGAERGLHFLGINADIERQFEFIQRTWMNDPKFGALYAGADPLFGNAARGKGSFFVQGDPVRRRWTALPPFVTVRGGAYFFLPGLQALRYLATLGPR